MERKDVVFHVARYLEPHDIKMLLLTCKGTRDALESLYKPLSLARWGAAAAVQPHYGGSWKRLLLAGNEYNLFHWLTEGTSYSSQGAVLWTSGENSQRQCVAAAPGLRRGVQEPGVYHCTFRMTLMTRCVINVGVVFEGEAPSSNRRLGEPGAGLSFACKTSKKKRDSVWYEYAPRDKMICVGQPLHVVVRLGEDAWDVGFAPNNVWAGWAFEDEPYRDNQELRLGASMGPQANKDEATGSPWSRFLAEVPQVGEEFLHHSTKVSSTSWDQAAGKK